MKILKIFVFENTCELLLLFLSTETDLEKVFIVTFFKKPVYRCSREKLLLTISENFEGKMRGQFLFELKMLGLRLQLNYRKNFAKAVFLFK